MWFVIFQINVTKRQGKEDGQEAAEPMTEFNFSCRAITMLYLSMTGYLQIPTQNICAIRSFITEVGRSSHRYYRRRGISRDLGLDEMLQSTWWTGHKELHFELLSTKWNRYRSFALQFLLMEQSRYWDLEFLNDLRYYTVLYAVNWTLLLSQFGFEFVLTHGVLTLRVSTMGEVLK